MTTKNIYKILTSNIDIEEARKIAFFDHTYDSLDHVQAKEVMVQVLWGWYYDSPLEQVASEVMSVTAEMQHHSVARAVAFLATALATTANGGSTISCNVPRTADVLEHVAEAKRLLRKKKPISVIEIEDDGSWYYRLANVSKHWTSL